MSSATRSKSSSTHHTMSSDKIEGLVRRLLKPILKSIEKLPNVEHLGSKITELHTNVTEKIEEQEQRLGKLEEKLEVLKGKVTFLENSLVLQNRHVDDLEQYGRRHRLRFYGFPVVEEETASYVLGTVEDVATKIGLEIPDSGFDRAHRIGRKYEEKKWKKASSRHCTKEKLGRTYENI